MDRMASMHTGSEQQASQASGSLGGLQAYTLPDPPIIIPIILAVPEQYNNAI